MHLSFRLFGHSFFDFEWQEDSPRISVGASGDGPTFIKLDGEEYEILVDDEDGECECGECDDEEDRLRSKKRKLPFGFSR